MNSPSKDLNIARDDFIQNRHNFLLTEVKDLEALIKHTPSTNAIDINSLKSRLNVVQNELKRIDADHVKGQSK